MPGFVDAKEQPARGDDKREGERGECGNEYGADDKRHTDDTFLSRSSLSNYYNGDS